MESIQSLKQRVCILERILESLPFSINLVAVPKSEQSEKSHSSIETNLVYQNTPTVCCTLRNDPTFWREKMRLKEGKMGLRYFEDELCKEKKINCVRYLDPVQNFSSCDGTKNFDEQYNATSFYIYPFQIL